LPGRGLDGRTPGPPVRLSARRLHPERQTAFGRRVEGNRQNLRIFVVGPARTAHELHGKPGCVPLPAIFLRPPEPHPADPHPDGPGIRTHPSRGRSASAPGSRGWPRRRGAETHSRPGRRPLPGSRSTGPRRSSGPPERRCCPGCSSRETIPAGSLPWPGSRSQGPVRDGCSLRSRRRRFP
jgi:hypothetical protein